MAYFFDGKSAVKRDCRFEILGSVIKLSNEERWNLSDVNIIWVTETEIHVEPKHTSFQKLIIVDENEINYLLQNTKIKAFKNPTPTWVFLLLAITCITFVTAWYLANPASELIAKQIPMDVERQLAPHVIEALKKDICDNKKADAALQKIYQHLRINNNLNYDLDLRIVKSPQINAFALPGGVIIFNAGLLNFASTPEEVAGVLAHEIQHHEQRHLLASLIRTTILTAGWQALVGDFSGILVFDPTTFFNLANMKFSRDAEDAADRGATVMLDKSQISTRPLFNFFKRLNEKMPQGFIPEFLSTHPVESRMEWLKDSIPANNSKPLLTDEEWSELSKACPPQK